MDKKIGIIVQARMASTRLPNKVMLKLAEKAVLWHVIQRCKKAEADEVIIATSINKENDIIEEFCVKNNFEFFRGSEEDVLDRYYQTAKKFKLDIIIRVTSDCPLIDPAIINNLIKKFKQGNFDYMSNIAQRSFPRGLDVEIFSFDTLEKAYNLAKEKFQREHVTAFIYNNPSIFKIGDIAAEGILKRPDLRICIDTSKDLFLLEEIYKNLYNFGGGIIQIEKVIDFLNKNPELAKVNIDSEKEHLERSRELKQEFIK